STVTDAWVTRCSTARTEPAPHQPPGDRPPGRRGPRPQPDPPAPPAPPDPPEYGRTAGRTSARYTPAAMAEPSARNSRRPRPTGHGRATKATAVATTSSTTQNFFV